MLLNPVVHLTEPAAIYLIPISVPADVASRITSTSAVPPLAICKLPDGEVVPIPTCGDQTAVPSAEPDTVIQFVPTPLADAYPINNLPGALPYPAPSPIPKKISPP